MSIIMIVNEWKEHAQMMGEELAPAVEFPHQLFNYNFGREIGKAPEIFWQNYKAFVEQMDGFNIDGYCIYGISSYFDYHNDLFYFNNIINDIDKNAPSIMFEESKYCIQFGSSPLDYYTYDIRTHKWESRDMQNHNNLFISCDTLAEFLQAVLNDIRQTEI
ncbi:MAG: YrhA family protein [Mixta calida]|uniref:YrhA family protein n=1 Tax=Mixta calida TaxID=665913 RepID=UPI00290A45A4|nr:YrhA family protein [Mixta calida]MDU4943574.1 YrhA family protein [Mixta calida]